MTKAEFSSLVRSLFEGPLDIVGDVHGEIDALKSLLRHLGYKDDGMHPAGRRLVFVGDLTDRGPDSPAVVSLVQSLIESGRAQCVLGNHDLNILLDHPKHENKWFFGEHFRDTDGNIVPQVLADESTRQRILEFFRSLPIALERDDLRVVHACWHDGMIDIARATMNVEALYHQHHELIDDSFPGVDPIDRGLAHQNKNPVKRLTSGPEERAHAAINAGGSSRFERRVEWWKHYAGAFCVFGHYSIPDGEIVQQFGQGCVESRAPRGCDSAFCVDYGVGKRWMERRAGKSSGFMWKLAALRLPERVVVFDEGDERPFWN